MKFLKLTAFFALNGFFCHALATEISTPEQQNIPKELSVFVGHDDLWAYVYHDLDEDGDTDALLITKPEKIKSLTAKNNLVLSILEKNKNGRLIKVAENNKIFSNSKKISSAFIKKYMQGLLIIVPILSVNSRMVSGI